MAANLFTGATDSNWGTGTNWLLGVPTAVDGNVATFNATSPACTVNASARVCNNIDFTGYTNTITMSQQITVSGNITHDSGYTVAGAGALAANANCTLTSNGFVWPNPFTFQNNSTTLTLADNAKVTGLTMLGSGTGAVALNGFQLESAGGVTWGVTTGNISGSTVLLISGTGTLTTNMTTGSLRLSTTFNSGGTLTWSGSNFNYAGGTLTYTAGTFAGTIPALLTNIATTTTFATAGIAWNNVTLSGVGATNTFSNDMTINGLFTDGSATNVVTNNGSNIICNGGLRYGGSSGLCTGTTVIKLKATQTVDAPSFTTGGILNPITFDAGSGTVTWSNRFNIDPSKLLYLSGTVTTSGTGGGTWTTGGSGGTRSYGLMT